MINRFFTANKVILVVAFASISAQAKIYNDYISIQKVKTELSEENRKKSWFKSQDKKNEEYRSYMSALSEIESALTIGSKVSFNSDLRSEMRSSEGYEVSTMKVKVEESYKKISGGLIRNIYRTPSISNSVDVVCKLYADASSAQSRSVSKGTTLAIKDVELYKLSGDRLGLMLVEKNKVIVPAPASVRIVFDHPSIKYLTCYSERTYIDIHGKYSETYWEDTEIPNLVLGLKAFLSKNQ